MFLVENPDDPDTRVRIPIKNLSLSYELAPFGRTYRRPDLLAHAYQDHQGGNVHIAEARPC